MKISVIVWVKCFVCHVVLRKSGCSPPAHSLFEKEKCEDIHARLLTSAPSAIEPVLKLFDRERVRQAAQESKPLAIDREFWQPIDALSDLANVAIEHGNFGTELFQHSECVFTFFFSSPGGAALVEL